MPTFQQQLQVLIASAEAKKRSLDEIIQTLRKAALEFDGKEVVTLDALREEAASRASAANRPATYFERVAQFFLDHANEPKPIREIALAVDGKQASVANVFYSTHKEMFESEPIPGYRNQVAWKMTEQAFQQVATRNSS
jgi:hypothetical protein